MTLAITIEKNIPIPSNGKKPTLPLGKLEVGDSFALYTYEIGAPCVQILAKRVSVALSNYSRKLCNTKTYAYRTINKTCIRVWRIK